MERRNMQFTVDPTDFAGLVRIMDRYGDREGIFVGQNEEGEDMMVSVSHGDLTVTTFQKNGWTRKDVYFREGVSETLFEGKWK